MYDLICRHCCVRNLPRQQIIFLCINDDSTSSSRFSILPRSSHFGFEPKDPQATARDVDRGGGSRHTGSSKCTIMSGSRCEVGGHAVMNCFAPRGQTGLRKPSVRTRTRARTALIRMEGTRDLIRGPRFQRALGERLCCAMRKTLKSKTYDGQSVRPRWRTNWRRCGALTVIEFHADRFLDHFRLHLLNAGHQCVSPIDVSIIQDRRWRSYEYSLLSTRRFFIFFIKTRN